MFKRAFAILVIVLGSSFATVTPAVSAEVNFGGCMKQVAHGAGSGHPADYAPGTSNNGPLTGTGNSFHYPPAFAGGMGC